MDGYSLNQALNLNIITVDSNNPNFCSVNNYLFSKNKDTLYKVPNNFDLNNIPNKENIIHLEKFAFAGSFIQEFIGWPNLRILEIASFHAALKLKTIDISMTNVTEIPYRCFWNSFDLEKILLPNSVTKIQTEAFENLYKIKSIYIPANVTAIEDKAFVKLPKLCILAFFGETRFASRILFENCPALQKIRVVPSYPSNTFGSVNIIRNSYLLGISDIVCQSVCNRNYFMSISLHLIAIGLL